MNTVNTEKQLMSNNSQTIKTTVLAIAISLASLFSINVNAQTTTSIEAAISEYVVAQGQQMMSQLNEQLQQTIASEVRELTFSLPSAEQGQNKSKASLSDINSNSSANVQVMAQTKSKNN